MKNQLKSIVNKFKYSPLTSKNVDLQIVNKNASLIAHKVRRCNLRHGLKQTKLVKINYMNIKPVHNEQYVCIQLESKVFFIEN